MPQQTILRVAVPTPLRHTFDYLASEKLSAGDVVPGMRVRVPFGNATRIGIVLAQAHATRLAPGRLKEVLEVLDEHPLLPPALLELLEWSAHYYHHPIGEVVHGTLPALLKRGRPARLRTGYRWRLTEAGSKALGASARRQAPRQVLLLETLGSRPEGAGTEQFQGLPWNWRGVLANLVKKGWVEKSPGEPPLPAAGAGRRWTAAPAQSAAMEAIFAACDRFQTFLLDGVTGSGKTEVYLGAIERIAGLGRQILVLIPEIGLTPQLVARFRERLTAPIVVLHSELGDQERLEAWLMAREGRASVVIGTRSAVFVPLKEPGMFIVDEEHDTSYKQQQGFRYSARDLAIVRGQRSGVPVVLGSATPSLESLYNVILGRYQHLLLPHRAGGAAEPTIEVLDVRARPFEDSLSQPLLREISQCLERGEQTLLFINRRGFAPVFLCHRCGWVADCPQCDAHLVYHRAAHRLRCHHCGQEQPVPDGCPQCGDPEQGFLGAGTQRVAQALARHFPKARIARVDRDSMRRTGTLEGVLAGIHAGQIDILVGTQMLTKGHHFPNVTLVGILEADGGLFGADFRASERMAQTVIQVAGRAGRGGRPGRVVFQTHHPEHPLLQSLVQHGYRHFAQAALEERRAAGLPPYTCMALLRAEAAVREPSLAFLQQARDLAGPLLQGSVSVFGPVPAPMERRAGRYRSQLLLESRQRQALQGMLSAWLPQVDKLKSGFRVRWSLDVDPVDMF